MFQDVCRLLQLKSQAFATLCDMYSLFGLPNQSLRVPNSCNPVPGLTSAKVPEGVPSPEYVKLGGAKSWEGASHQPWGDSPVARARSAGRLRDLSVGTSVGQPSVTPEPNTLEGRPGSGGPQTSAAGQPAGGYEGEYAFSQ